MVKSQIGPFRADHVGSFLRPEKLKQARANFAESKISAEDLRAVEDEAIAALITKQKEVGLQVVTDGEFRRKYWHFDFIAGLDGIKTYIQEVPGFFQGSMAKLDMYVVEKGLGFPKDHPFLADFAFVKEQAGEDHVAKITIPGPNMLFHSGVVVNQLYKENPAYESIEAVADAIVATYKDIIQTFYDAGCRYLQFDDTSWGAFFSEHYRDEISKFGYDAADIMKRFADVTIRALEDKPEDMAVTLHICRGNFKSAWLYEGDYEPVAKELFGRVNVDAFFLEFDNERSGDFAPLKHIKNQKVVLGLVTTKADELEDKVAIKARIKEAEEYVPLDQLCVSPQCGFASTEEGNLVAEASQWEKLGLVVDVAGEVWG